MNKPVSPPLLKKGDTVMVVSTARKVLPLEIEPALHILKDWGLEVILGEFLFSDFNQFAGKDEERLKDLQNALDSKNCRAIFCARGGYGTGRIIDKVEWTLFEQNPKWVIGFSDVTILLNHILNLKICSLHAPMPLFYTKQEYKESVDELRYFLFNGTKKWSINTSLTNKKGAAEGILVGGNLSIIVNSIGTSSQFEPRGKILFLEDIDEYLYHIDRMFLQLKRAGILKEIEGLIIGHFSDLKDNPIPFGETVHEIVLRNVEEFNYPVAFGFPTGHEPQNLPLPVGSLCSLKVDDVKIELDFL